MAVNSFNAQNPPVTTKGDLFTFSTIPTRLGVGANNTVLTADSSTATGLKWATPASGGKVLQVVQTIYSTETTISTTAATDTGLSASITPSSTSSRVLVMINQTIMVNNFPTAIEELKSGLALLRGSTNIYNQQTNYGVLDFRLSTTIGRDFGTKVTLLYVDSPNTTSSTTYKTQALLRNSNQTLYAQTGGTNSSIILMEIGA